MKVYKRKLKWKDKVNWRKVILLFFIVAIVGFLILFYIVGSGTELRRAIGTSIIISLLIAICNIISSVIYYDDFIVLLDNKKRYLLCNQDENFFFDASGNAKRVRDYDTDDKAIDAFNNLKKNIGINSYLIDKYDIIKVDNKYIKVKLEGTIKKWDRKLVKRRCEYFLIEEKEERIVTIDNRFDKYDELIKLFK